MENGLCFQEAEDQLLKYDDGVNGNESAMVEHSKEETGAGVKFGWIEGVLVKVYNFIVNTRNCKY